MSRRKMVLIAIWVTTVVGYAVFSRSRGVSALGAAEELRALMADNWWGPIVFIVAYVVRPIVLFPATVLTVLGGLAFGLVEGSMWTIVAATVSTATVYVVGRFFGTGDRIGQLAGVLGGAIDRATRYPFEATVVMRLLYLPFDAVAYVAGYLRLRFLPFAAGSVLGTLPGTVAFVGFGASIESLDEGTPAINMRVLVASVVLALCGMVAARWLRQRQPVAVEAPGHETKETSLR